MVNALCVFGACLKACFTQYTNDKCQMVKNIWEYSLPRDYYIDFMLALIMDFKK